MKLLRRILSALVVVQAAASHAAELRVSAAASLSDAMTEISALHEKVRGAKLVLNLGGSNALARQIKAGAPCDVFLSADEATLAGLIVDNLVDKESAVDLLGNSLAVIVPSDSPLRISSAADLAGVRRLALGDPAAVPAGVYARKWLEGKGLWSGLSGKIVASENVRAALAAVASANADAGIVYVTDAAISKDVKIAYRVPVADTPAIVYPAAVTTSAADPAKARLFIDLLKSPEASGIFRKYGFVPLAAPETR